MRLDPLLKSIISMKNIDRFSITEIRTAYIALLKDEEVDKGRLRQFIYDELNKLVKKGWLSKTTAHNKRESRFKKTGVFNVEELDEVSDSLEAKKLILNGEILVKTQATLNSINADLLESMGALDTLITMKQHYPQLGSELTKMIMLAKEQKHILKGKASATQELLTMLEKRR